MSKPISQLNPDKKLMLSCGSQVMKCTAREAVCIGLGAEFAVGTWNHVTVGPAHLNALTKLRQGHDAVARLDAAANEADLHNDILAECRGRGWICFHGSVAHRTRRTVGEPDFVILADAGRVLLVEAKTKGGKLSPAQQGVIAWAERLGHPVYVVRSLAMFLELISGGASRPAQSQPSLAGGQPDNKQRALCPSTSRSNDSRGLNGDDIRREPTGKPSTKDKSS